MGGKKEAPNLSVRRFGFVTLETQPNLLQRLVGRSNADTSARRYRT